MTGDIARSGVEPLRDRYEWIGPDSQDWYHAPGQKMRFTEKQGQYLAFIYNYSKIHGRPPAERDMEWYFKTSPPSIHQMVLKLEEKGLISRVPGQPRSIQLLVPPEELPILR